MYIYKDDPFYIFELITQKIKLLLTSNTTENNSDEVSSLSFSFIVFIFFVIIPIILSYTQGIFFPENTAIKTMGEDIFMFCMLFLVSVISYFIHSFYIKFNNLKHELAINLKDYEQDKIDFDVMNKKWLIILGIAGVLFTYYTYYIEGYMTTKSTLVWFKSPVVAGEYVRFNFLQWILFFYFKLLTAIVWFEMISLGVKGLLLYRSLSRIYKKYDLKIRRFAPDECGGLKIIGLISLNFFTMIAIVGFYIIGFTVINFQHATTDMKFFMIGTVIGYAVLGPIIFFGPMYSTHREIKSVKKQELNKLEDKLEIHHKKIDKIIDPYIDNKFEEKIVKEHSTAIEHLKREKIEWQKVNDWPFDRRLFNGFISRYVSPFVIFPIKFILDQGISEIIFENIKL